MSEPWRGSLLRLGGGCVLLGGPALADVVRALEAARRVTRADGYGPDPRWLALLVDLRGALDEAVSTARAGSAAVPQMADPSWSLDEDLIDSAEVARMLGCKPRNVRDLKARGVLDARLVAGRLLFARSEVAAELLRRRERRCA